jgi:hypothetical protein
MAINKVRITSKGRAPWDVEITDAETGEPINCVTRVKIIYDIQSSTYVAILTMVNVEFDVIAPAEMVKA